MKVINSRADATDAVVKYSLDAIEFIKGKETANYTSSETIIMECKELIPVYQNFKDGDLSLQQLNDQIHEYMSKNFMGNCEFSEVRRENRKSTNTNIKEVKCTGEGPSLQNLLFDCESAEFAAYLHEVNLHARGIMQQIKNIKEMAVPLHHTVRSEDGELVTSHCRDGIYQLVSGKNLRIRVLIDPGKKVKICIVQPEATDTDLASNIDAIEFMKWLKGEEMANYTSRKPIIMECKELLPVYQMFKDGALGLKQLNDKVHEYVMSQSEFDKFDEFDEFDDPTTEDAFPLTANESFLWMIRYSTLQKVLKPIL